MKTWIPLIVAVVLGLFAAMAARQMLAVRKADNADRPKFVEVVVARNNLTAGSVIQEEDLTLGKIETVMDPAAVFTHPEDLAGRVVQAPVFQGLPVLASQLAPKGMGGGLQALVPDGMCAITVEVNEFSGVGGFLVPGCHVDVIAALPDAEGQMVSRTIVQRVKVTAVGQRMTLTTEGEKDSRDQTRSVTLIATPQEAEAIELAASTSRPRLVLRSGNDQSIRASDGVTVAELRGRGGAAAIEPVLPIPVMRPTEPVVNSDPAQAVATPTATPVRVQVPRANSVRSIRIIRGGVESNVNMAVESPQDDSERRLTADISDLQVQH